MEDPDIRQEIMNASSPEEAPEEDYSPPFDYGTVIDVEARAVRSGPPAPGP